MNDFDFLSWIFGTCIGILVGSILVIAIVVDNSHIIEECEQTLPRDQNCVLIAIPEE
ncbi:hypothetical protein D3C85_681680 [compost metagenome]